MFQGSGLFFLFQKLQMWKDSGHAEYREENEREKRQDMRVRKAFMMREASMMEAKSNIKGRCREKEDLEETNRP